MELTRRHFVAGSIGALALPLVGCGNDVTNDLDLLLTATEAAVDIAFPQYATLLTPYFDSVTTFIDEVDTELASTDAPAVKASVIAADAAKIVAPDLSGVAASIVTKIGAIAPLVAQIVADVKNLVSELDSYPAGANAFFAAKKVKTPGAKDLEKVRSRNAAIKAKIAAAKPKAWTPRPEFYEHAAATLRWLRIQPFSGATLNYSYSDDGVNFAQVYSEPSMTPFTTGPGTLVRHIRG